MSKDLQQFFHHRICGGYNRLVYSNFLERRHLIYGTMFRVLKLQYLTDLFGLMRKFSCNFVFKKESVQKDLKELFFTNFHCWICGIWGHPHQVSSGSWSSIPGE